MGRDKASIELDGRTMAARVVDAVAGAGAAAVICVGGDTQALRARSLPAVADDWPGQGPLGGLLTALRAFEADGYGDVFVASCDLLRPDPAAVAATVAALSGARDAEVAVPLDRGRRRQWLHAAWRVDVRSALEVQFEAGERSLHRAVSSAALKVVEIDEVEPAALADADTPDDLPGSHHPRNSPTGH
jgi:molybdopterin-guanine dinucleotide biosynthesis protein A